MSLLERLYRGGWLRAVDHALAESLRRLRPDSDDFVLAAAALCSRAVANGHSRLPLAQVGELLAEIDDQREPPPLPGGDGWRAALLHSPWIATTAAPASPTALVGAASAAIGSAVTPIAAKAAPTAAGDATTGHPLVFDGTGLYLRRYWRYQQRLADALRVRLAAPAAPLSAEAEARIAALFPPTADAANPGAEAARIALGRRLLLLTGGPGTGKTTTVARLLALAVQAPVPPRIALAAPTGKAAGRLGEAVRESLAQLVAAGALAAELAPSLPGEAKTLHRLLGWRADGSYRHDATHPLPAEWVVVDEASMIDLPLMARLLAAVAPAATLVLIGDRDQLPSVETGDVLAALCDAAEAPDGALAAQRVHLTRVHRQTEGNDVGRLAAQVRAGDADAALAALAGGDLRGVVWQAGRDAALEAALRAQAVPAYQALQSAPDVAQALAWARRFRVLTALREGPAGSETINAKLAAWLDPARRGDRPFRGHLLLITENSYRHGLFNGDIGIVWPDEHGELRAWFEGEDGPRAWLPSALPAHESAFALTVHKSQGSEFDEVFLALPETGARVLSRELLYTGLTRCRRGITLWANEGVLRAAIARRAQRWSGLAECLGRGAGADASS